MFLNREDAGIQLAAELEEYRNDKNAIVVALPRGGIVPGYIIATELRLPLTTTMVKKIGHPRNPEYAIGAAGLTGYFVHDRGGVSQQYIDDTVEGIQNLLRKRHTDYFGDQPPVNFRDKNVIVVDDGVATGSTLLAALEIIRKDSPRSMIVAVPVGPPDVIRSLEQKADKVICLEEPSSFYAIGAHYEDFGQVPDSQVKEMLGKAKENLLS